MSGFPRAIPGQPVQVPASFMNELIAIVERSRLGVLNAAEGPGFGVAGGIVTVRNDTGLDVRRFRAMGVEGPLFDVPGTDPAERDRWASRITLRGVNPTAGHSGRFVVALEAIKAGQLGRCRIAGPMLARVRVVNELDSFVGVSPVGIATFDPEDSRLRTSDVNGAPLLWIDTTEIGDERWALFDMGRHPEELIVQLGEAVEMPTEIFRWQYPWNQVAWSHAAQAYSTLAGGRSSKVGGIEDPYRMAINRFEFHPQRPQAEPGGYILLGDCGLGEPAATCPPSRITVAVPQPVPKGVVLKLSAEQSLTLNPTVYTFEALNPTVIEIRGA